MLTKFSPEQPDLAFVRVGVRGLPALELDGERQPLEGMELATAGFPMGTDALVASGVLGQVSPTLQTGVVSAILPYPCSHPHGFLLNVMVRCGASGSPVFFPDSGGVAGILHAGLNDFEFTPRGRYLVPTNLSYILPSRIIEVLLENYMEQGRFQVDPQTPTLDQLLAERPATEADEPYPWQPLL